MVAAGLPRALAADYVASHSELGSAAALLGQLIGIRTFRQPMAHWADLRAKTSPDTTWLYDFRWPSPFYSDLAVHCVELPFAWNLLDADGVSRTHGSNPPRKLAQLTHAAWVAFVTNGDPGWRPGSHGVGMVFNENSGEQPILEIERRLASAAAGAWSAGSSGRGLPVGAARSRACVSTVAHSYPPEAFAIARDSGLGSAPQAGEAAGPPSARGALERWFGFLTAQ